jgi:hypothetical protein
MQTLKRVFVDRVAKIPTCVEWLFDAELIVEGIVPIFVVLRDQSAKPYRENVLVVVEFVRVETKELEQKISL